MQKCYVCGVAKPFTEFNKNKTRKSGYANKCRDCQKKYHAEWYENNRDYKCKKTGVHRKDLTLENRKNLFNFFKKNPCVDCGETNIVFLEFDHIRDKKLNISQMMSSYRWKSVKKEMDKCEVRCNKCHILKTAKQYNWWTYQVEYLKKPVEKTM